MKRLLAFFVTNIATLFLYAGVAVAAPAQRVETPITAQTTIAKMQATWDSVKTYECTVTVHEIKGDHVQDRVYVVRFERPNQTRVDIVGGDGRGSAAVWSGGDKVRGHQGGMLSFIRLNVTVHSKLATDMLGHSITEANFGALLTHLRSIDPKVEHVTTARGKIVLVVKPDPTTPASDVVKEVYILAPNWLPIEFYEYAADKVVRHVVNSGLKLNTDIPASTWRL